ncbi:MAG: RNA polymerase sigma factor [Anaerolineales bacterium]
MVNQSDDEDLALVKKAKQGDTEAFGEIFERHASGIYRYFYVHLNNAQEAEDLMADVFFRTWKALPEYRQINDVPFRVFLFRIARNRLVDYYRSRNNRQSDWVLDEDINDIQDEKVVQEAENQTLQIEIRAMMNHLREDYRSVIELRFFGGLSPEETAQVMGRSEGAVRVLQHRALVAIAKLLGLKK